MKKNIFVEGMKCQNCARHVKEALNDVEGVNVLEIDLEGKKAIVNTLDNVNDEELKNAFNSLKYKVTKIEEVK